MHSNEENSGSESENDFESLFEEKIPEESVFYFKNISVQCADCFREVTYTFNVDDSVDLSCSLTIAEDLSSIPLDIIERMLLAIGLCALPWYWMGFSTRRIVIEKSACKEVNAIHPNPYSAYTLLLFNKLTYDLALKCAEQVGRSLSEDMVQFWNVLYEKVLLEFMYVNKLNWAVPKLEVTKDNCSVLSSEDASRDDNSVPVNGDNERSKKSNSTTSFSDSFNFSPSSLSIEVEVEVEIEADRKQIIPLGGGKDSLVAWHLARSQGLHPVLLYVADGMEEFENNWRLNEIARTIGTDIHIVKHVFTNSTFENRCRSYLKPCGHPWAALVLFDSVLISSALGINSVSFGYEKSADYGNGIEINGVEVNHQYDKSSEFLHLAQQYVHKYLNKSLNLTSELNKMWELEIAKIFCLEKKLKKFHRLFLSCNEPINDIKKMVEIGKKESSDSDNHLVLLNGKKKMKEKKKNREENGRKNELDVERSAAKLRVATDLKNKQTKCEWCCACEKCAFIFLLLSAWMPLQEVVQVFGINMFEDEGCLEVFLSLIGADGRKKPFECVGTFDEAKASVCLALRRWEEEVIKRDAVPCAEAIDAHTVPFNSEKKGERVGEGGNLNNDKYEKQNKGIEEERHCNTSTLPLPLPLPPLDFSSMPLILGILRTHVHLDFHDMKYFHLMTEEEILNAYGMAFSN